MKKLGWFLIISCCLVGLGIAKVHAAPLVTDSGILWLVNQDNRLDNTYVPKNLVSYGKHALHPEALSAYEAMLKDMRAQRVNGLYIQSAYRSYDYQQQIFLNKKTILLGLGYDEETAIEMTSQSIAFPGASEHQTGLALDVTLDGTLRQTFGDTEAGRWIADHAHEYGFVVRYQDDKRDITRIIYEPWHLRYVGMPHSAYMKEKNLCYEEYIDFLKANGMYIYRHGDHTQYLVMYTLQPDISLLRNVVGLSADRPGENPWYIVTMKKVYPGRLPKN